MTDRPQKDRPSSKAADGYPPPDEITDRFLSQTLDELIEEQKAGKPAAPPSPDEIMDRHVEKGLSRALAKKKKAETPAVPPPAD
jgi:hypothetical protein